MHPVTATDVLKNIPAGVQQVSQGISKAAIDGLESLGTAIGTKLAPKAPPSLVLVPDGYQPSANGLVKTSTPQATQPTAPSYGNVYHDSTRNLPFSDKDLQTAKNVIYAEVSNRAPEKQQLEAKVILNTALNRLALNRQLKRGPQTLEGIFTQENQYQGYDPNNENPVLQGRISQYNQALQGVVNKQRASAIDAVLSQAKSGKLKDDTNGGYYYIHHPDGSITYDDTRKLYK